MKKENKTRPHSVTTCSPLTPGESLGHEPVMLQEVIAGLAIKQDGVYVDATYGRGGHAKEILRCLGKNGRLYAIDKDPEAIKAARLVKDERLCAEQGSFTLLQSWMSELGLIGKVDGILLDFGVSSPQLETAARGFSFLREGPLDMRMDTTKGVTAAEWINSAKQDDIANVIYKYGEERFSRRIAGAIVKARVLAPITTTSELAAIVAKAHPRWERRIHPATRTFQALRIYINHELEEIAECLEQALNVLSEGGRMLTISFHSLEDRIVKQFIQHHVRETGRFKLIGRLIRPTREEIAKNARSRSAKLRIAEKIA